MADFGLTLHVGVFSYGCHLLTLCNITLIFAVETAVGNYV